MAKLFGTDGVRGEANSFLTPEIAFKLGRVGGYVLTSHTHHTPSVLVAKDGRRSGDMLEAALVAGLCSIGARVHLVGILPTPAVAYLVKQKDFDCGVMISASHNLMADNGIKFFSNEGYKLPDEMEKEIEDMLLKIENENDGLPRPVGEGVGTVKRYESAQIDYLEYLYEAAHGMKLDGLRLVIDCANGATSFVASRIFKRLGADVYTLHSAPDGVNINKNCGSTHIESLIEHVLMVGADVGLAFDGDGDRMLAVCENGELVDGDKVMALCGLGMKKAGKLAGNTIVATIMSNQGLEIFCKQSGINLIRTDVGDRYVLERMLEGGFNLGGEQSGHVIFLEHSTTGDGILTGLKLLELLVSTSDSMSKLASSVEVLPQVLVNAAVPNEKKPELATNAEIAKCKAEIEAKLAGQGRILVRPSGTEPVVRVMLEGKDKAVITEMAKQLADVIEKALRN